MPVYFGYAIPRATQRAPRHVVGRPRRDRAKIKASRKAARSHRR